MTQKERLWQIFLHSGSTEDYLNYRRCDIENSVVKNDDGDTDRCFGFERTEYR